MLYSIVLVRKVNSPLVPRQIILRCKVIIIKIVGPENAYSCDNIPDSEGLRLESGPRRRPSWVSVHSSVPSSKRVDGVSIAQRFLPRLSQYVTNHLTVLSYVVWGTDRSGK
jgi:hypothetical protein